MTQWHDYTILWGTPRATFLVDGAVVPEINISPSDAMPAISFLSNAAWWARRDLNPGLPPRLPAQGAKGSVIAN